MTTVEEFYQRMVDSDRTPLVLSQEDAFNPNFQQALNRFKDEGHTILVVLDDVGKIRQIDVSEMKTELPEGIRRLLDNVGRKL